MYVYRRQQTELARCITRDVEVRHKIRDWYIAELRDMSNAK